MLRMRLQRRGKRNYATYRVVVAERRAAVKSRAVADLGWYNPHTDALTVDAEKVTDWIGKGAQPTATVNNLLVEHGVLEGEKMTSWKPKKRETAEKAEGDMAVEASAETETDEKNEDAPKAKMAGAAAEEAQGEDTHGADTDTKDTDA